MKQFILSFSLLLLCVGVACASPDRPISKEQLPATAQQFLQEYFADVEVTLAHEDGPVVRREYDVTLADGTHIEFSADGRWREVESRGALPQGIVPMPRVFLCAFGEIVAYNQFSREDAGTDIFQYRTESGSDAFHPSGIIGTGENPFIEPVVPLGKDQIAVCVGYSCFFQQCYSGGDRKHLIPPFFILLPV